jgi:hypothetical protein
MKIIRKWTNKGLVSIWYYLTYMLWIIDGRPYITTLGYHCGCCGRWVNMKRRIPKFLYSEVWSHWEICDGCDVS